jgi:hypothetical protein
MHSVNPPKGSRRIGVVHWNRIGEELAERFGDVMTDAGHDVVPMASDEQLPGGFDAVFVHGPFGSLVPLGNQLLRQPPATRPALVWWLTEQLWNPALPDWVALPLACMRSRAERMAFQPLDGGWTIAPSRRWLTRRGTRYRYFGDFRWLGEAGVLTVLAVPSPITQTFLRRRGVDSVLAFCGAHPRWESPIEVERDIPVLWLGMSGSRRRRRLVDALEQALHARGIPLHRVDGVINPAVHGDERSRLLRRTKIVVNLMRQPWDCNILRFYLSAPNRTLMITEPILRHTPVQPGVHLVEAPFAQLADTIARYLSDDKAREHISNAAYELVTKELTMANGIRRILDHLRLRLDGTPRA